MTNKDKIVLGIIGRVSPEKNTRKILQILSKYNNDKYIIKIAGLVNDRYSKKLYNEYKINAGIHEIEWLGWISHENISNLYDSVDAVLIASNCIENGPLTLYEALHHKKIIIISNTPNIVNIIQDEINGYLIDMNDLEMSLIKSIKKIRNVLVGNTKLDFEKFPVRSVDSYIIELMEIYKKI